MATKAGGVPCYDKADDNEPIFVLRAKDVLAPMVVRYWAELAAKMQVPTPKVLEAFHCAEAMQAWGGNKHVPD
jgi:hypothetical protein